MIARAQLMFPYPQHPPTCFPKGSANQQVTGLVCRKFLLPEFRIALGCRCVLRAAMPEAAVHKHCYTKAGKNEVRLSEDWLMPPPAGELQEQFHLRHIGREGDEGLCGVREQCIQIQSKNLASHSELN
jgi:hypothetical protein